MAKTLNFKINDKIYDLEALKLDRKKLYGFTEKVVLDNKDNDCKTLSLYPDLAMVIPKGGIGLGTISEAGKWIEKSDMIYINEDNEAATLIPSSYDGEINLKETVSIEYFLEHNIVSVYSLQGEENHPDFVNSLKSNNRIFTFVFNYRADYEGDPAFLIENDGEVFVLVGKKIEFKFLGINEYGVLDEIENDSFDDENEFDFAMM